MKRAAIGLLFVLIAGAVLASTERVPDQTDGGGAPIYGVKIPTGYRDWKLISVAHEEGKLNDIRAILGNDIALEAYRDVRIPFPDGTMTPTPFPRPRHRFNALPPRLVLRSVGTKQQSIRSFPVVRCRTSAGVVLAGDGQRLGEICRDWRMGIRPI